MILIKETQVREATINGIRQRLHFHAGDQIDEATAEAFGLDQRAKPAAPENNAKPAAPKNAAKPNAPENRAK